MNSRRRVNSTVGPQLSTPMKLLLIVAMLAVALPSFAQQRYVIPRCAGNSNTNTVGDVLKLSVPEGAEIKSSFDTDYGTYAIAFGSANNRVWLKGIYGNNSTRGVVPKQWLTSSTNVTRRTWVLGRGTGTDIRGTLKNGNRWRYFGHPTEDFHYYDVSTEAAAYFDQIIDNVCFQLP
jgi:hypothetical protein